MSGTFEITLDADRQIIIQKLSGTFTAADSRAIKEQTLASAAQLRDPAKVRLLVDARFLGKPADAETRSHLMENMKDETLCKMAIWGAGPMTRTVIRFVSIMTGLTKVRTFAREKDAVEWLLND